MTTNSLQRHRHAVRGRLMRAPQVPAGPDTVTWRINREILVVAGWGRAILLQFAHPALAAGVDDHSTFRGSLLNGLRRMQATVGAMLSLTFGDEEQMIEAAARINAIHDRVRGHVRDDGAETYSAHDPELQRWVHVTLLESIPLTYEHFIAPLARDDIDRYCVEATIMEPLLGMPAGWLPRDAAARDAYMREMLASGALRVTDRTRALARALLYPPRWRLAWPAFRPVQLLTIGTLPPALREAYGFRWTARDARALARWTAFIRAMRRLLPRAAREWPIARRHARHTLRRRRAGAIIPA